MLYILAAIGLYFVLNFVGYVMRQNHEVTTTANLRKALSNPIEEQRIRQQHTPLLTEEMMHERIARIYASTEAPSFEHFQHYMLFVFDSAENKYHLDMMQKIATIEKQFVEKYGFNMNERQIRIVISHLAMLLDEDEIPYW